MNQKTFMNTLIDKFDLSTDDMANTLCITPQSVRNKKSRGSWALDDLLDMAYKYGWTISIEKTEEEIDGLKVLTKVAF